MTTPVAVPLTSVALSGTDNGPWNIVFKYQDAADISVWLKTPGESAVAVEAGDLTITGATPLVSSGTVEIAPDLVPEGGWAAGAYAYVVRTTPNGQTASIGAMGAVNLAVIETALDRLARQGQDQGIDIARTLKVPLGETLGELPDAETRALSVLAFDEDGEIDSSKTYEGLVTDLAAALPDDILNTVTEAGVAQALLVNEAGATQVAAVNAAGGTQAGLVNTAGGTQVAAVEAAGAARLLALGAAVGSTVYADTTAGLAATASGGYFWVVGADPLIASLYLNNAGVAVLQGSVPASRIGSYANPGGTGDRTATIIASATSLMNGGTASNLVDGATGNNTTDSITFSASAVAAAYLRFDFGPAAHKVITEATWKQSGSQSHGTWKWQSSNDALTWADIGASFTLGGSTSQVQTTLSANLTPYRYYQLLGVSGTASGGPYIQEIEFKLFGNDADGLIGVPAGGLHGQSIQPTASGPAWADNLPRSYPMYTTGILGEWLFNEGAGATAYDRRGSRNIDLSAPASQSLEWTPRGVRMTGGLVQTPSMPGLRTLALLVRQPHNEGTNFLVSGGPGATSGLIGSVAPHALFTRVDIGLGEGVSPVYRKASSGIAAYRLNRGGMILIFLEYDQAYTSIFGIGGRHSSTLSRLAECELVWMAGWSGQLDDAARATVFNGVRMLARDRGVFLHYRDCQTYLNGLLAMGQSNMVGEAVTASLSAGDQALKFPNVMIAPANAGNRYFYPEQLLLGVNQQLTNPGTNFGPEFGIAKALEAADYTRRRGLVIAKTAVGSTYLAHSSVNGGSVHWNASEVPETGLLNAAMTNWWQQEQALMGQGIGCRLLGVDWMQGEQDAIGTATSAGHDTNLQALWDTVKTYMGYSSMTMSLGRIRNLDPAMNATASAEVRTLQAAFDTANSDVTMIDTDTFALKGDNVHYDHVGMPALGAAFYAARPALLT